MISTSESIIIDTIVFADELFIVLLAVRERQRR